MDTRGGCVIDYAELVISRVSITVTLVTANVTNVAALDYVFAAMRTNSFLTTSLRIRMDFIK